MAAIKAKFSPSTNGVYPVDAYAEFPSDAIDIPTALYTKFTKGLINSFTVVDGAAVEYKPAAGDPRESMSVTAFQAKAAILRSGLYDQVDGLMHHPDTPLETKLAWEEVLTFKRLSPTVLTMGAELGLTDAQLDELFELAATIEA